LAWIPEITKIGWIKIGREEWRMKKKKIKKDKNHTEKCISSLYLSLSVLCCCPAVCAERLTTKILLERGRGRRNIIQKKILGI